MYVYKVNNNAITESRNEPNDYVLQENEFGFAQEVINYTIVDNVMTDTTTQQDRDDRLEAEAENQREALISKRESDGRNAVKKLRTYVLKKFDEGIINEDQVDNIHNGLIPVVEALKNADWKKAQKYFDPANTDPYITYINPPSNSDLLDIYNTIKDKIDAYVTANY